MVLKEIFAKILAYYFVKRIERWSMKPIETQKKILERLIKTAKKTSFGKDHNFKEIKNHKEFVKRVPVRSYEELRPYVERVKSGETNVLWPGKPIYFAKTSGTTSGSKYIPITKESAPAHINSSRDAMFHYINQTGNTGFLSRKVIFLQGSPELEEENGIKIGRLSGITAHLTPRYLKKNVMPSWETNCIKDWEKKVHSISVETSTQDMAIIGGIPPWVQMYFEKLKELTKKETIKEVFPNFNLFVYGGVNFNPYIKAFKKLIGKNIDTIEFYPASEGFFAYQNTQNDKGLLLQINSGIYYEFIPLEEMSKTKPLRLDIGSVEIGVNYVLIISTNAGLWGYNTGDTVSFTSKFPHKVIVTGRYNHFISAFGEHVISSEVEKAMSDSLELCNVSVNEFTVAPNVSDDYGESCHEWWIEFNKKPTKEEIKKLELSLENSIKTQNSYYNDLVEGKVLKPLKITAVHENAFKKFMKKKGKLGGQNKLPRLCNNREIVSQLDQYRINK